MWPSYSAACRRDVDALLKRGGSLSAYKANPQVGVEPSKGSWAWRLERDIESRFKVKNAVAVNSGTAALHAALVGAGITSGEVVTSPFSFSATVSAIVLAGATPVFADVDPLTYTITPETVKRVAGKRTRCILPVDLFGGLAPFKGSSHNGIPIIRDSCQAVGASLDGAFSGSDAVAAAYSFNGGKQVPAGECGAMVTNSDQVALQARYLMNHGENFHQKAVGLNYRPNEVTCCIAWHGLQSLKERNRKRSLLANYVHSSLAHHHGIMFGNADYDWDHDPNTFYVLPFTVKAGTRDRFIRRMKKRGITVGAGYIQPTLNRYPAFRKYQRGPLPVVEELSKKTLCLLYDLTPDKPLSYAEKVAKAIKESLCD